MKELNTLLYEQLVGLIEDHDYLSETLLNTNKSADWSITHYVRTRIRRQLRM